MSTDLYNTLARQHVILFGEALADIFPDGPVMGGAPLNVSCHLQAFGLHPMLITRTGTDELHRKLIRLMRNAGMTISGIQSDPHYPTGQVLIKPGENGYGHQFEILENQAYDFIDPVTAATAASSIEPDLVYFGTLAQRSRLSGSALETIFRYTPQTPRLLDINLRKPWYTRDTVRYSLTRADHVKVNEDELIELPGLLNLHTRDPRDTASRLIEEFQLHTLLVTCGAEGAWLLDQSGNEAETPGITDITIIDTVGAGDGFSAVFILGMLLGWPETLTLERANRFAAALCGIRGAIPESSEFYSPFLKDWGMIN